MTVYTHYPSPIGTLLLISDGQALTGLQPAEGIQPESHWVHQPDHPVFQLTTRWLENYFQGRVPDPRSLPLSLKGTAFQHLIWDLLLEIPWGQTRTYGQLAREVATRTGRTIMSSQAVGGSVGRNPIAIIIPCHRIIGADGKLTGYAWGLDRKRWLLQHEGHEL